MRMRHASSTGTHQRSEDADGLEELLGLSANTSAAHVLNQNLMEIYG
jgi:hypothetical protein